MCLAGRDVSNDRDRKLGEISPTYPGRNQTYLYIGVKCQSIDPKYQRNTSQYCQPVSLHGRHH